MPIAALDSGGAPAPVAEATPQAVQRLAYRQGAFQKRNAYRPRRLRRIGLVFAVILLILMAL